MNDVIARWDKFLASIESRLQEVLTEARQGCAMLLQQSDLDPTAMSNAWTAMELRAKGLASKVADTWSDKVEPAFEDADAPANVVDAQREKGDALQGRIEVEVERTRIAVFAGAAREIWQRAVAEAPRSLACTQCAAELPAPQTLAAVNVTCPYCQAVNTFEPGMRARMIEHFCAHPLSEEASWDAWLAMRDAEARLHAQREPKLPDFKAYEAAQIAYWRRYLEARAAMLPHLAPALEADLRGKLQHWYVRVHHEKAWAEAGRPRVLP
jgi:predicted RNA-binding Zn ribbon-like protein